MNTPHFCILLYLVVGLALTSAAPSTETFLDHFHTIAPFLRRGTLKFSIALMACAYVLLWPFALFAVQLYRLDYETAKHLDDPHLGSRADLPVGDGGAYSLCTWEEAHDLLATNPRLRARRLSWPPGYTIGSRPLAATWADGGDLSSDDVCADDWIVFTEEEDS